MKKEIITSINRNTRESASSLLRAVESRVGSVQLGWWGRDRFVCDGLWIGNSFSVISIAPYMYMYNTSVLALFLSEYTGLTVDPDWDRCQGIS